LFTVFNDRFAMRESYFALLPQMHKRDHTALRCIAPTITKIRKQAVPDARWSMSLLTMAARIIERCYTFVVREMSPIMLGE
jgi:hypothetical protein